MSTIGDEIRPNDLVLYTIQDWFKVELKRGIFIIKLSCPRGRGTAVQTIPASYPTINSISMQREKKSDTKKNYKYIWCTIPGIHVLF